MSVPVLAYLRPNDRFILDFDVSGVAMGTVLSQVQDGVQHVIAHASKALSLTQHNYCTTNRELLAVVTFAKQFCYYLLGRPFLFQTDHASLTWLLNLPEGMVARWIHWMCI